MNWVKTTWIYIINFRVYISCNPGLCGSRDFKNHNPILDLEISQSGSGSNIFKISQFRIRIKGPKNHNPQHWKKGC